jgi:hypothetical protein
MTPVVVTAHYFLRLMHGDYPWYADAIAIPIFTYWVTVFPFNLVFLVQGQLRYKPNVSLLAWNPRRFWPSVGWTALSIVPVGITNVGMILDGIEGRLYWVSAFFLIHLLFVLVFRASLVMYEPDAQPIAPPNGGPATLLGNPGVPEGPPSVS